jgi:cell shape-determining protein MreD
LLYLLGLIQVGIGPYFPELALVAVVVFAFHEGRLASTLLGALAGLVLDLSSPVAAGASLMSFCLAGYTAASLKLIIYRGRWAVPLLSLAGLALKLLLLTLQEQTPDPIALAVSGCLTLAIALALAPLLTLVFYAGWNPASSA